MGLLALDKWARLCRIIKQHGGIRKSLYTLWRMDTLKEGTYVGCDSFGNKYYMNDYYNFPRNRWVDYNMAVRWNYDASQISAEWYGWLHHKTDKIPNEDRAKIGLYCHESTKHWLMPHEENLSGTDKAYYPYSTTPNRISAWDGSSFTTPCTDNKSSCSF